MARSNHDKPALPLLDWLRFAAAFMVVLKHGKDLSFVAFADLSAASHSSLASKVLFGVARYGIEAVLIFFVLSGFLVGGATFRRLKYGGFDMKQYAADRASRIMVPLIPAIAFAAVVQALFGNLPTAEQLIGNLLSLQGVFVQSLPGDPPLWSLTYEVWFYVLNGAIATLIAARSTRWAFGVLCMGVIVFSFLQLEYLFVWYLGALLFVVNDGRSSRLGLVVAVLATAAGAIGFELFGTKAPTLAVLALALAVMLLIRQLANWPCRGSPLTILGSRLASFSYSLYLVHYPVLLLLGRILPRFDTVGLLSLALYALRVAVCMVAGWIFFLCFERHTPGVRVWLRHLSGVKERARAPGQLGATGAHTESGALD